MAAASNMIAFGLCETPAVVAQDQEVFLEGQPISHDQDYAHVPSF